MLSGVKTESNALNVGSQGGVDKFLENSLVLFV